MEYVSSRCSPMGLAAAAAVGGDADALDGRILVADFGTALGDGDDAMLDTGSDFPFDGQNQSAADISEVISASGLDFPTTNCVRVQHLNTPNAWTGKSDMPIASMAVGDSIFYRYYFRNDVANGQGDQFGANHHWIEPAPFDGEFQGQGGPCHKMGWHNDGTTQSAWDVMEDHKFIPHDGESIVRLNKFQTYRTEIRLLKTAADTYTMQQRIYDSSNTLLFDEGSIVCNIHSDEPMETHGVGLTLTTNDLKDMRFGINGGPAVTGNQYHYFGAVMIRISANSVWPGPYQAGEKVA